MKQTITGHDIFIHTNVYHDQVPHKKYIVWRAFYNNGYIFGVCLLRLTFGEYLPPLSGLLGDYLFYGTIFT